MHISRHSPCKGPCLALLASFVAMPSVLSSQNRHNDAIAHIERIESGLLPPIVIAGQSVSPMSVAEAMEHYHVPGMSVAFIDHGKITWTRTYGVSDVAAKTPVTVNTMFQAASISKPVSAVAAMRLVQEGKLSLDGNVNDKLKTWKVPENQFTLTEKVTLRRLLSHTAGLNVSGLQGYPTGVPLPTILQTLNGESPANNPPIRVVAVPGTVYRYSGGGYTIVRVLMTDVTQQSFPQLMEQLIFRSIGMEHSTFDQPLSARWIPFAATAYDIDGQPYSGKYRTYPEMAPDGLWTTPTDLARFAIEVQNENAGKSHKILTQSNMRQMLTPQQGRWGLGFELNRSGEKPSFDHGGAVEGFKDRMQAFAEAGGQGIVIMTNGDGGGHLRDEYIRAVSKEYGWSDDFKPVEHRLAPIDSALYAHYVGVYNSPDFGPITVSVEDGRLYIHCKQLDLGQEQLLPESKTQFFVLCADLVFRFTSDSSGIVTSLTVQSHTGTARSESKKRL